jgi:dipeptidyl aminopeptidase/acylaminoacyl peptidase
VKRRISTWRQRSPTHDRAAALRDTPVTPAVAALIGQLFAAPAVSSPRLDPAGERLAFAEHRDGTNLVSLTDLASGQSVALYRGAERVLDLAWTGQHHLAVTLDGGDASRMTVFGLPAHGVDTHSIGVHPLGGDTWMVDPLRSAEDDLIVGHVDEEGVPHVYRATIDGPQYDEGALWNKHRLDDGIEHVIDVATDGAGVLRAALSANAGGVQLLVRAGTDGPWRPVKQFGPRDKISLVSLDPDGASLYALTNVDRPTTQLVRIDLASGRIAETLLALPDADLDGALTRPGDDRLIGAVYARNGVEQAIYFDRSRADLLERFRKLLPGRQLFAIDGRADGSRLLLLGTSETDPGSYYLYDAATHRLQSLFDVNPGVKNLALQTSQAFEAKADDGLVIHAFLTLPAKAATTAPVPLVVMPHGGPVGISDTLDFDPEVQFLVQRGYAVLRVNYRGSGGAGRKFEEAGFGGWGSSIEGDIQHAVTLALARYPLDPGRVALFGASYGGYSALMGLIGTPARYRCAIARAAPTDLALMFSNSDWSASPALNKLMRTNVGDPDTALAALQAVSPLYDYRKLSRPLLLVHGTADRRVGFEHALRLEVLLTHAGHAPEWLPVPGMGHGATDDAQRLAVYGTSERFLASCLAPPASG